jgi:plasmid stabilization system protein ParE
MTAYDAYFDSAANKLTDLERQIADLGSSDPQQAESLASTLRVQRERLASLRRAGAEVTPEMTQSFAASLERLARQVGERGRRAA